MPSYFLTSRCYGEIRKHGEFVFADRDPCIPSKDRGSQPTNRSQIYAGCLVENLSKADC